MNKFKNTIIFYLLFVISTACHPATNEIYFGKMSDDCKKHFELNSDEREKLVKTYDLEKQLRLLYCEAKYKDTEVYSIYISERGKEIIPLLLTKLEASEDEWEIYSILNVFELLKVGNELENTEKIVDKIRNAVSKIKYPILKDRSQKILSELETAKK